MIAQAMRAILLASATATTLAGFLASSFITQGCLSGCVPRVSDDRRRTDDEQPAQIAIALLGDAAEPLLAAGRVLPRNESDPGGELASRLEDRSGRSSSPRSP